MYYDPELHIIYKGNEFKMAEMSKNDNNYSRVDNISNCTADEMFNYSTIFDAAKVREVQAELIRKGQC